MTQDEVKTLISSTPSNIWRDHFTEKEWLRIVEGLYKEYKQYSKIDIGFVLYYQSGLSKLMSNDGPRILRERFL